MASTQSPTFTLSESPSVRRGDRFRRPGACSTARSVRLSTPTSFALCFLPSAVTTSISVARSTTWALVSTMPDGSTMTPEPRLRCLLRALRLVAEEAPEELVAEELLDRRAAARPRVTVLMLTTAGRHRLRDLGEAAGRHGQRRRHDGALDADADRGGLREPWAWRGRPRPRPRRPRPGADHEGDQDHEQDHGAALHEDHLVILRTGRRRGARAGDRLRASPAA